jgi:hypothetical protein
VKVPVSELREVSNQLLDHLERLGVTDVEIPDDYYWSISKEQLYDPTAENLDPTLGQLSDDWKELSMIRRGERPPVALALGWLASVMRAVGERVLG